MKFLITGGAGFIGSSVIRLLISETEHQVLSLDKLTYAGNFETLDGVKNNLRYRFVQGDVRGNWPIADELHARELSLPISVGHSKADVVSVSERLAKSPGY